MQPFNYPVFDDDIDALRKRLADVAPEHQPLLSKWVARLIEMNDEMRHLERLEHFSRALTEPNNSKDS